jgi:CBS domain-containing protein
MRSVKVAYGSSRPNRALTVRDVMTSYVVTTSPDKPVADAAAAMVRHKVGSALIMQGRILAGILTERDVLRAAASGSDLMHSPVSAWMTRDPEQASPDTTVEDALQLMLLHGFRHLPVLEDREVRGVVSLRDLAAARITRSASRG